MNSGPHVIAEEEPDGVEALCARAAGDFDPFAAASARLGAKRSFKGARMRRLAEDLRARKITPPLAEQELRDYLATNPDDADALWLLSQAMSRLGSKWEAASLLARCLEAEPDFLPARFNYANLQFHFSKYPEGLQQVERLLTQEPDNPLFRQLKAEFMDAVGENEESLAIRRQLASENPGRAESWISYGDALRANGVRDQAIAAYRRAIECRPAQGRAYWCLANLKTFRFSETDIANMESVQKSADLDSDERIDLQFALGKAYEDLRAYRRSWEHYAKGNAAARIDKRSHLNVLQYSTARVAADKALFTRAFFESRREAGCKANEPIFVLGRLRSGSTLIEQILCSHSAIEATAELTHIPAIANRLEERDAPARSTSYPGLLATLAPPEISALGQEYLDRTRLHRKLGRPFFVDKSPSNYVSLGLIALILPNAKIIDARRHPAASCFSIFKQNYKETNCPLGELGRHYRNYVDLMAHFDRVLPGRVCRVIYENMVRNPEDEIRRIFEYLGLQFEERCLYFYETRRAVHTPSSEQVRRPISEEAVDHWRNYEPWLGPLIQSLGSVFTDYPEVPPDLT